MGFQDALANVCAPISIKIDIDPGSMLCGPQMPPLKSGGSIVEYDHEYNEKKECKDAMGKLLNDIMCKMGMCPPEERMPDACPSGKPGFGGKDPEDPEKPDDDDDEKDSGNPFAKNRVRK